tara:strand:- start:1300 stop:1701 length:402 start_codon:yes stop_codon:yes gene_type:complete
MKITRSQLHKLVSETLKEVKITKKRLKEAEVETPDVKNVVTVLDKTPRFELMVQKINTRKEFFDFLEWIVELVEPNLTGDSDVIIALKQTLESTLKRKQQRQGDGEEDAGGEEVELSPDPPEEEEPRSNPDPW